MPDNIEEIKSKLDIVDLVQEYIQCKPAGTNNFKANCPFHHEKTPSFMVSRDKQIWHCFGCGEGGDIFSFVQKMEGLEFPEVLRILAKKAGVQLQYQDPAVNNQKTRMLDVCKAASEFYHTLLLEHPKAQFVRDYVKNRGITDESVETWQLGFAPDSWDVLNKFLVQKGFKEEDIFQAGLTIKKERGIGYNDRFRNRLMFSIWDTHGAVIGFGGRWLGTEDNMAKYINSPQTLIYNKSAVLYGINKAKQEIKKQKLAIIVEGYMDCIASYQAGVTNVVASSGTALTTNQVRLLKRFSTNLAFAFDQDLAGDTAAKRGIDIAWQEEMNTKVILIYDAKDPDELIKKDPEAWKKAITEARSIMEYYFESTLQNVDLTNVDDKKSIAKILLPVIAKLADTIEQTHYIQKLAGILSVEERVLRDKLGQMAGSQNTRAEAEQGTTLPQQQDRFVSIGEGVLGVALRFPDHLNYIVEQLLPEEMSSVKLQNLYKQLIIYYTENNIFDYIKFIQSLPEARKDLSAYAEVLSMRAEYEYEAFEEDSLRQVVANSIKELKRNSIHKKLEEIEAKLKVAEQEKNNQKIEEYSQLFTEASSKLKQFE